MTPVCELCDAAGGCERTLVQWLAPVVPGRAWAVVTRCVDRAACRVRVDASGRPWLLRDPVDPVATVTATEVGALLGRPSAVAERRVEGSMLIDLAVEEWRGERA